MGDDTVKTSYSACRRLVRRSGSNFARCLWLLPPPKRRAMEALYAFLRITDDLADQPVPATTRQAALQQWRLALDQSLQQAGVALFPGSGEGGLEFEELLSECFLVVGGPEPASGWLSPVPDINEQNDISPPLPAPGGEPSEQRLGCLQDKNLEILPALMDTVRRFRIPPAYLYAVLDGVGMDVAGVRYETFEHLALYCHRVASAVGLACLCIWGSHSRQAAQPAIACGLAFQLTNILRDLKEDARMGRLYLPVRELAAFGYSTEDFPPAQPDDRFGRLIRGQVARTKDFYRQAGNLWDFLDRPGRRIFGMMYETYRRLLDRIAQNPARVLTERVRLSGWEKLTIALRWTLWPSRRWLGKVCYWLPD